MGFVKKLIRPRVIIWAAVSIVLAGVVIAANLVAMKKYKGLLEGVLGYDTPILKKGDNGIPFEQEFTTKEEARENGNKVVQEICEEGMVLLKNENNALPLKANAKVSVFGKNSVNLVYGGSGSAAPGGNIPKKTLYESLADAGIAYNPTLKSFYDDNSKSGSGRGPTPDLPAGGVGTLPTGETPVSSYNADIVYSYEDYSDAAIFVLSRIAGENWDLPTKASDDSSRHYLELDNNERAVLKHIADSGEFDHIILLVNSSNYPDLGFLKIPSDPAYTQFGSKIDAAIVVGSPGGNGIMALGKILTGEVNPSGHTVDTLYTNYKNDPTFQNFGDGFTSYANAYRKSKSGGGSEWAGYYFVEYEENIYQGYRYYETRGQAMGEDWYNANVVYPFGHGLSYTTFSQEIANATALNSALTKEKFEVSVKVTNTGTKAGKEVVQLYVQAPYTANGIEKPYKVLVGFGKTNLLAPNEEEVVKITVDPYDFASFDNHDRNTNNFKGYELDAGDYVFHVAKNAHTDYASFTKNLAEGLKYEKDPVTETNVVPLFNEVSEHMEAGQLLSRKDFADANPASFPVDVSDAERTVSSKT